MPTEPPDTGGGRSRRIRRVWIVPAALVGLAVLIRVALPYLIPWAIGWGAMRQAGLAAHLENADLWLLRGAIALEGLTVAQGDDPPPDGQTPDPDSALLALDRLYLDVAWLDLFRGMLRVTEIDLERPRVSVQRLADGRIDPLGQGPGPPGKREEPAQEPAPQAVGDAEEGTAEETGWPLLVERFGIRGAELRILDKLDGEELAALDLKEAVVQAIRVQGTSLGLGGFEVTEPAIRVKREFALDPTGGRSPAVPDEPAAGEGAEAESAGAPSRGPRAAYRIDDLAIDRAAFSMLVGERTLQLALRLKADDVTLEPGATFPLAVGLEVEDGRLDLEGTAGAIPPFFDGTLRWENLPVPPLTLVARPESADWFRSCRAGGELRVLARLGALEGSLESPGVRASGSVQISEMDFADPSGEEIHLAWKSFDADLSELAIPIGDAAATTPLHVALAKLVLTEPRVLYTRPSPALEELLAGPTLEEGEAAEGEAPADAAPAEEPAPEQPAPAAPPPEITIDRLELRGGEVRLHDDAVTPPYRGVIRGLAVTADKIDAMEPSAENLAIDAKLPGGARLAARGSLRATDGELRLDLERMDLPAVNPYAAAAGVEVAHGSLSLRADIRAKGSQRNIKSNLTLHQLRLDREGSKSFVEKLDMPVDLILSLLRSPDGDIALPLSVAFEEDEVGVGLVEVIMGALRQAMVGIATIPLKAFGGVFGGGGVDLEPIRALPGTAELGEGAEQRLVELVDFLETRPGLAVRLSGQAGDEDRLALAEAELADRIAAGGDLPKLPDGEGAGLLGRGRIERALEKRAEGEPLSLSEEDQGPLRRYLERVEVPQERYHELARERARAAQRATLESGRIGASRVELADPGRGAPGVRFRFDAIPISD